MTAGISLIPGKAGAHRAPLQMLDSTFSAKKGAHHEQKKQKREDGKVRHVFVCQETSNNNGDRSSEAA